MAISRKTLEKISVILNPNVTHKALIEFLVLNGNPNGDPATGGVRLDSDAHALVSDVATKRKIRDYVEGQLGRKLFISRYIQDHQEECEAAGIVGKGDTVLLKDWARHHNATTAKAAVETFWDVRMCGGVLGVDDKKKHQILGPVQLHKISSLDVVEERVFDITRLASEVKGQARTMGKMTYVPFAEFHQPLIYTGHLGKNHNVSSEDMLDLWEATINGFDYRPSTMRGNQRCVRLTIRTYPNAIGALEEGEKPVVTVIENPDI